MKSSNIKKVLKKLNQILPLKERQSKLKKEDKLLHQYILKCFATSGKPPQIQTMNKLINGNLDESLQNLHKNDLIIVNKKKIIGCYPFSISRTDHKIYIKDFKLYAVCAFDAVGISSAFYINVNIISVCAETGNLIKLTIDCNKKITNNNKEPLIGIHWQKVNECAANSICKDMVFLEDKYAANKWAKRKDEFSILTLEEAIKCSGLYFSELLN